MVKKKVWYVTIHGKEGSYAIHRAEDQGHAEDWAEDASKVPGGVAQVCFFHPNEPFAVGNLVSTYEGGVKRSS